MKLAQLPVLATDELDAAAEAAVFDVRRYRPDSLSDLARRAEESGADNATLLRTMSHELKTPLNAIIGFSDLLASIADRCGPEQVREYAGLIHQGGHNLLKLITQILDLTKIAGGCFELRSAALDAGGQLWLVKNAFAERAAERAIAIDADLCPVGLMIDADENLFTQTMHQLVDNAVRYTREGGEVRLSAVRNGPFVDIQIADNGPGVEAEDLPRLLQAFEHGVGAHGAGLGLTLVKAFAEAQGGTLSLDSAPGKGFRATVSLPTARA